MPFNPIEHVAQCTILGKLRNQDCQNVFNFLKASGAPSPLDLVTLGSDILNAWVDQVVPLLSNDYGVSSIRVRDLTVQAGVEIIQNHAAATGGLGDAMPNNVAFCISKRTPFVGKNYRGRFYIGGVPRTVVTENDVSSTWADDMAAAIDTFKGPSLLSPGWTWVLVGQKSGGVVIPGGLVNEITFVGYTDLQVDTLQKRMPGKGS